MKTIKTLIWSLLLVACQTADKSASLPVITGYDTPALANGEGIAIDSFYIVPLAQCEKSVLSSIKKIEFIDSLIVIGGDNKLLAFHHRTGEYLCSYGAPGNAANEYVNLTAFWIDRASHQICILDDYRQRLLRFSVAGEFMGQESYPEGTFSRVHQVSPTQTGALFASQFVFNRNSTVYSTIDLASQTQQPLYTFGGATENGYMFIGAHPFAAYEDQIRCVTPFSDTLFIWSEAEGFRADRVVATSRKKMEWKEIAELENYSNMSYMPLMLNDDYTGFTTVFETANKLLLGFYNVNYFLVDKVTGAGCRYAHNLPDMLHHLPLWNIKATCGDFFVGVAESYEMAGWEFDGDSHDPYLAQLKAVAAERSLHDNPVLLFYRVP